MKARLVRLICLRSESCGRTGNDERGQGTVEASFTIPILFTLILMLIQPGVILYDRIVMGGAAAEGCRLLATSTGGDAAADEAFIKHRLASIPPQEFFHVHDPECTWEVDLNGSEDDDVVSVTIRNQVKPLPLLSLGIGLLGLANDEGNIDVEVSRSAPTQPSWVWNGLSGSSVSEWAGAWMK